MTLVDGDAGDPRSGRFEHGPQAAMPIRSVAVRRLEKIEVGLDLTGDLLRREDVNPGCGELNTKWKPIYQFTDPIDTGNVLFI